jgi:hypothetical protein
LSSENLESLYPAAEAEEKNEELFTTGDVGVGVSTAEEPVLVTNMENSSLAYLLRSTINQTQNKAIRTEAQDERIHSPSCRSHYMCLGPRRLRVERMFGAMEHLSQIVKEFGGLAVLRRGLRREW